MLALFFFFIIRFIAKIHVSEVEPCPTITSTLVKSVDRFSIYFEDSD